MRLLVIGGGGREHALIWKLSKSPRVGKIFAAPGNGGIAEIAECLPNVPVNSELVTWASRERVDLVVVGPEAPLVAGFADECRAAGLPVFGPSSEAARLEGSKSFAKEIMIEAKVPTGFARVFSNYREAESYIDKSKSPYVVKADGLAAGKGVIIARTSTEAKKALSECLIERRFGKAGRQVLVEEYLSGPEVSVLAFVDGETIKVMPPAQDYKRVGEGDTGPNTGGMGAYAPAAFMDKDSLKKAVADIIKPTVKALAERGVDYKGVLYAGLMLTDDGPKTLEFNVRFGDPETQALIPLLESDLADVMFACAQGRLADMEIIWSAKKSLTVVLASEGYPRSPIVNRRISGLSAAGEKDVLVFHAGTKQTNDGLITSGGRILNISATGDSFTETKAKVYEAIELINIEGGHFRADIGKHLS